MEHLGEVDAALRMVAPDEDGAMDVLKGVQVRAYKLLLGRLTSQHNRLTCSAPHNTLFSSRPSLEGCRQYSSMGKIGLYACSNHLYEVCNEY